MEINPNPNVEKIMQAIRENVEQEAAANVLDAAPPQPEQTPTENSSIQALARANELFDNLNKIHAVATDGQIIDPSGWEKFSEQLKQVNLATPSIPGGIKGKLKKATARLARFPGQEAYNNLLREHMNTQHVMLASMLESLNIQQHEILGLQQHNQAQSQQILTLNQQIEEQRQAMHKQHETTLAMVEERFQTMHGLVQQAQERYDLTIEQAQRQYKEMSEHFANHQRAVYSNIDAIHDSIQSAAPTDGPQTEREARLKHLLIEGAGCEDFDFLAWEEFTRGSESEIKSQQDHYSTLFIGQQDVLDIGCGRGEFLDLLKARGISTRGIDIDTAMVRHCQEKGHLVEYGDALEYLGKLEPESLGGVFAAQVVEHMTISEISELVRQSFRVLRPGGPIVLETQNPQCLSIFSGAFYSDPTHVKPIHPIALRFFLHKAGFRNDDIHYSVPIPESDRMQPLPGEAETDDSAQILNANFKKLNSLLFSYAHYAVIAKKPD